MARIKPIRTKRLLIEPFSKKHLTEQYVSWLNNPVVVKYSEQKQYVHTIESCRAYWKSFEKSPNYFSAISVVNNGKPWHIGNSTACPDKANKTIDMTFLIGETKAWGKGYAIEAWLALCAYFFTNLKIHKLTAGAISPNKESLRFMERAGMRDDGRRIRHYFWRGKPVNLIFKAFFREDLGKIKALARERAGRKNV